MTRVWVGGPVPRGADAITLGSLIIVRKAAADDEHLMRHERVHVVQWRALGLIGFLRRYLGAYFRWRLRGYNHWGAYRRIPLEVEAEWVARRAGGGQEAPPIGGGVARAARRRRRQKREAQRSPAGGGRRRPTRHVTDPHALG